MSEKNYVQAKEIARRIAVGVGGALVLVCGALANEGVGLVCVAIVVVLLLLGWGKLLDVPHPNAARLVMGLVALVALGVANWGTLTAMSFVLGLSVAATFVAEMLRRDGRPQLLEQAAGTFTGCVLIVMATLWIFVWCTDLGRTETILVGVVLATVALVESIPARTAHALALFNGAVAGLLMAWLLSVQLWLGFSLGIVTALIYVLLGRATRRVSSVSPMAGISRDLIAHCILGMLAYMFSWLLV
ncbi:MAG: hypothetical protein PUK59_00300 [Actinomycetaceae bacterium]|nr:hypothetical protein [Actinomycetaceae bacterium]MDY5854276.1 hypothetical protein [Arcanobacterium sp.]